MDSTDATPIGRIVARQFIIIETSQLDKQMLQSEITDDIYICLMEQMSYPEIIRICKVNPIFNRARRRRHDFWKRKVLMMAKTQDPTDLLKTAMVTGQHFYVDGLIDAGVVTADNIMEHLSGVWEAAKPSEPHHEKYVETFLSAMRIVPLRDWINVIVEGSTASFFGNFLPEADPKLIVSVLDIYSIQPIIIVNRHDLKIVGPNGSSEYPKYPSIDLVNFAHLVNEDEFDSSSIPPQKCQSDDSTTPFPGSRYCTMKAPKKKNGKPQYAVFYRGARGQTRMVMRENYQVNSRRLSGRFHIS
ncbi:Hypothetical protein POVR1_LOCUS28 [uncultured virus]|nr:Hypothetical protein POVR1_LOCUS28 [uncultured virus]